jgi:hypothetical protein
VRTCWHRARHLLLLNASEEVEEELKNNPICFDPLEKCVKVYRAHRSANDFDRSFIKGLLDKMLQTSTNPLDDGEEDLESVNDASDGEDESDADKGGNQDGDQSGEISGEEESDFSYRSVIHN